ncbi:MAG TPA: ABC transporter permease [Acidimicrobiales bacterium]|nr:ABC transporter permease [Acidimicrobiales bacterium]
MSAVTVDAALAPAARPRRRSALSLLAHQVRFDLLVMSRNRAARFFVIGLPVLMLVLFASIFGRVSFGSPGLGLSGTTYYVCTQVVFGIVGASFMSIAMTLIVSRESGVFKRRRATPVPAWMIVASRAVVGAVTSFSLTAVLLAVGHFAYGASVPGRALLPLLLAMVVGTLSFGALGFALSGLIRSAETSQAVVQAVTLPLFFISGVFVPWGLIPPWLRQVAAIFPVRHLAQAVLAAVAGNGVVRGADLLVVGAWGAAGLVVAARRFAWSPRSG